MRHVIDCVGEIFSIRFFEQHHAFIANLFKDLLEKFSRKTSSIIAYFFFKLDI